MSLEYVVVVLLIAVTAGIVAVLVKRSVKGYKVRRKAQEELSDRLNRKIFFLGFYKRPEFKEYSVLPNLIARAAYLTERFPEQVPEDKAVTYAFNIDGYHVEKVIGERYPLSSESRKRDGERVRRMSIDDYNKSVAKKNQETKQKAEAAWNKLSPEEQKTFRRQRGTAQRKDLLLQYGQSKGIDIASHYPLIMSVYFSGVSEASSRSIDSSGSSSSSSSSSYDFGSYSSGGSYDGGGSSGSW